MNNTEIYNQILRLANKALTSEDEVEKDLFRDVAETAYNYTGYRLRENFYSREQKIEQDAYRTSCHNRYMDALNIFLRYEKSLGEEIPVLDSLNRKDIGDIGNQLVADLAIKRR